jgi:hypothetical protein
MKLLLVRHLWGVDLSGGFSPHISSWHEVGYQALEGWLGMCPDPALLRKTLQSEGFRWISLVFSSAPFSGGGSVQRHLQFLREQIENSLDPQPLFFNAHTGSDSWTATEAEDFYGLALDLEKKIGVPISHETHRSRYFGNPWHTQTLLQRFPELKLTCDFSHWVCVAERLLGDCADIIQRAASQCFHLHARVGYEEGPQVSDPRAPEWKSHLEAHEAWWTEVWNAQLRRGMETVTLTPEFGPPPYQHTLPYSQKPVSDLTDICDWMSVRQAVRFRDLLSRAEIGRSKRVSAPAKNRTQSRRLEPDAVGRGPKIQFEP